MGRGGLELTGGRWQPGHEDAVATIAQFNAEVACRLWIGATVIWEGIVSSPRAIPRSATPSTLYRLSGLLEPTAQARVDLARAAATWPEDSEWGAIGLDPPALLGATTTALAFAPFEFSGSPLQFAGLMAALDGRLAGENCRGLLVLPTYSRIPTTVDKSELDGNATIVTDVSTDVSTDTLRNVVDLGFSSTDDQPTQSADGVFVQLPIAASAADPAAAYRIAIGLPDLAEGQTRRNYRAELLSAVATMPALSDGSGEVPVDVSAQMVAAVEQPADDATSAVITVTSGLATGSISWRQGNRVFSGTRKWVSSGSSFGRSWTVPPGGGCPSGTRETSSNVRQTVDSQGNVTYHVSARCQPGSYQTVGGSWSTTYATRTVSNPDMQQSGATAHRDRIKKIEVKVRLSWDSTVTTETNHRFTDATSVAEWGERPVEWPPWIANENLDAGETARVQIEADLAALGQPRIIHTIRMPLWQTIRAHGLAVAGYDIGDYVQVAVNHPNFGVAINADTVTMLRTIEGGQGVTPAITLALLQITENAPPVQSFDLLFGGDGIVFGGANLTFGG